MAASASAVKELREISGAGMMDCKRALDEAGNDIKKAMEVLRKSGVAKAKKKQVVLLLMVWFFHTFTPVQNLVC